MVITYNGGRLDALIYGGVERLAGGARALVAGCALQSRHTMTWEWEYRSEGGRWIVTVGGWHAVVQRVGGARVVWQATLTRTMAPHQQYIESNLSRRRGCADLVFAENRGIGEQDTLTDAQEAPTSP